MDFVNRVNELKKLKSVKDLSERKLSTIAIYGLRRVGKTRLVLNHLNSKDLYFFVNKDKSSNELLREFEDTLRNRNIITSLETLSNFDMFFKVLFERFEGQVVFDEFQNFSFVSSSVYGTIQKTIDLNENKSGIALIFLGSLMGLLKTTLRDRKEAMYGRIKNEIKLKPMKFREINLIYDQLEKVNFEERVKLYLLFGGYPQYSVMIEDLNLKKINAREILDNFFFDNFAPLEEEVQKILSMEFGSRKSIYYNILFSIANGNRTISEIASSLNIAPTSITRQLNELVNHFEFVDMEYTYGSKRGKYYITHNLINLWFNLFYKNLSEYKRRSKDFITLFERKLSVYYGREFGKLCREFLSSKYNLVSRATGKIQGGIEGKNTYEIDIVCENKNKLILGECKFKDKVNSKSIASSLLEKSRYIKTKKEISKYLIFAKSLDKKIKEFNGIKVECYDLKEMQKIFA